MGQELFHEKPTLPHEWPGGLGKHSISGVTMDLISGEARVARRMDIFKAY